MAKKARKDNGLTVQEESFCVAYTAIGTDTFSNGTSSAIAAGYSEESARTQAWKLLKKDYIKARILALHEANMKDNMVSTASVLAELAHDRLMSRKNHQYSVSVKCTELEGRYLAMWTDKVQTEAVDQHKPKTEQEAEALDEAARVYKLKLSKGA
jgi:phage terminase small subunit